MVAVKEIFISDIGRNNYEWKISVKVQALWREIDQINSSTIRMHFILIDTKGDKIHAILNAEDINDSAQNIVEGNIYTIERFRTYDIYNGLRFTNHESRILIKYFTIIKQNTQENLDFSANNFNLLQYSNISSYCNLRNKGKCIDIIGRLDYWNDIQQTNKNNSFPEVRFIKIRNESYNLMEVKLYGSMARKIEEAIKLKQNGEQPIVIITSTLAKFHNYKSGYYVHSSFASRIFVNLTIPVVEDFKDKMNKIEALKLV